MNKKNIFCPDIIKKSYSAVFDIPNSPAKLTFMIADLKVTPDGKIKILEFGNGMKAIYNGYNQIAGNKMLDHFWKYLTVDLDLPIFYVKPKQMVENPQIMKAVSQQYNLLELENNFNGTLTDLGSLDQSLKDFDCDREKEFFDPNNIFSYSGVLITDHCVDMDEASKNELSQRYPHLLHLNSTQDFNFIIANKISSNGLFAKGLEQYKPSWLIRDKEYNPVKARAIINTLQSDYFVIKPIDSCRGNGVIVCNQDELDDKLHTLSEFHKYARDIGKNRFKDLGEANYWRYDTSPYFLIEEYVPSINISSNGNAYDPTMRVAFAMQYYDNLIKTDYFGAYWKLPATAKISEAPNSKSAVSRISASGPGALAVSTEHQQLVTSQLDKLLPEMYLKLLNNGAVGLSRFLVNDDKYHNDYTRHILEKFGIVFPSTLH